MKDFTKDTGKPLNTFIEEDVPVQKFRYDPEKKKIFSSYQLEKQKVMYVNAPKEKYHCKSGEHIFHVVNPRKGVFTCDKCNFSRQVYPSTYMFKNGQLIHKVTGKVV